MRLISAGLEGFKRFEQRSEINLDFKLVALVGPNESGKSSVLRALSLLTDPEGLTARGDIQDASHHSNLPPSHELVWARFALDTEDRALVASLDGAKGLRWFRVALRLDGELRFAVEPRPKRNLKRRMAAARQAKLAGVGKWARALQGTDGTAYSERLERLGTALDTEEASLPSEVVAEAEALASELPPSRAVTKSLRALVPVETAEEPYAAAVQILSPRVPEFLLFTNADRELNSAYELEAVSQSPPAALRNLCRLANLNLGTLWSSVSQGLVSDAETIIERANERLRETFTTRWSQAGVEVRLNRDGNQLRIFAGNRDTANGYVNIDERSDGMRWFVSLLAFLSERRHVVAPILLVDEAETHLHYDAQADLMQMLGHQTVASKVVYSTHSAGCLPEDLGAGLRAIKPHRDTERSEVVNWVWSGEGNLGLTPLLLAMGASALAFTPARLAVITEGASDFILLPTLMREATKREVLGFQFAPGASEAGLGNLANIETDAARVLYLVDGDDGGKAVRKKLLSYKIPSHRILSLPAGIVVEDLVADQVYADALNEELHRSHGDRHRLPRASIPARLRPVAVDAWCRKARISPPRKRAVAIHVLSAAHGGKSVLKPSGRTALVRLFNAMQEQFQVLSGIDSEAQE